MKKKIMTESATPNSLRATETRVPNIPGVQIQESGDRPVAIRTPVTTHLQWLAEQASRAAQVDLASALLVSVNNALVSCESLAHSNRYVAHALQGGERTPDTAAAWRNHAQAWVVEGWVPLIAAIKKMERELSVVFEPVIRRSPAPHLNESIRTRQQLVQELLLTIYLAPDDARAVETAVEDMRRILIEDADGIRIYQDAFEPLARDIRRALNAVRRVQHPTPSSIASAISACWSSPSDAPQAATRKRPGRHQRFDAKEDRRVREAMDTGRYRNHAELGVALGRTPHEIGKALDRDRKRTRTE